MFTDSLSHHFWSKESDGGRRRGINDKTKKRNHKTLTLVLLREITKTFTGKQAQSGNSGSHFGGKKSSTFGQISQVEPSKALSARTRRRGRKDHLETRTDIRLSGNYSNKHGGEWHLILDVSQWEKWWMPLIQTKSDNTQTTTENKHGAQCTGSYVWWDVGLLGCKVGQRLVYSKEERNTVIRRSKW